MSGDYDWSSLERQVRRAKEARRWETVTFPASGGGTLHYPAPSTLDGRPLDAGGPGEITIGTPPIGEIIRLHADTHLGNGGEPVFFDGVQYRNGFAETIVPGSSITLPHDAIYGIEGGLRYQDGYCGGGTVTLVLDGVTYSTLEIASAWNRLSIAEEFDGLAGSRLQVFVDHDDTTTDHELHGVLEIATKEPLRERVPEEVTFDGFTWAEAGGNTGTVDRPDNVEEGDLLVAMAGQRNDVGLGAVTTSLTIAGFTQLQLQTGTGDDSVALVAASKTATGSEPASYGWSLAGAGSAGSECVMVLVKGGAVDQSGKNIGAQPHNTPDVSDIAQGQLIVGVSGKYDETPNSALPAGATLIKQSSGAVGLVNRSVTWWWSGTVGTSVRTINTDTGAETLAVTLRVGPS